VNLPCTLKLTGTATDGTVLDPATEYDIRIFGIEMVQVLAGSFVISSNELVAPLTLNHFRNTYSVTSETGTLALNFKAMTNSAPPACYNATAGTINVPANFPKGVNEFYCMKYEVTQGAYTDFLNTLAKVHIGAPPATVNRNTNNFGNNRHRISYNTSTFWASCDRPDRACNFLSQEDLFAYLDWACLRPMTEIEYEKVCRGTALFAADEFPWGSTNNQVLVAANGLSGAENGAETVLTPNANRLVV
jgi:hypothetical protein